ncbi:hypothetical protein [Desulfuromonas sp. TF]|uniref:hypothetical protein n=1 Tax=Desulfuromonas sp. TF TaxID=1232410 RepID=UPI000400343E|nr:hypothetical protein [Desulfuromonas sp. TF]
MAFDTKKFTAAKWGDRTEAVPVPDLAAFFAEGDKAVIVVRALAGEELARANAAAENARRALAVAEGLAAGSEEIAAGIRELLGMGEDTPADFARRLAILEQGAVEPKLERAGALTLARNHGALFYLLTQKILELTALGRQPGKPGGSGPTPG